MARRPLIIALTVLALILLGTVIVLSSATFYLSIDKPAFITEQEIFRLERPYNESYTTDPNEKIPRIIHQTWKTEILPDRWRIVSQGCRDLMPD